METKYWDLKKNPRQAMEEAAALVRAGEVVAFPTETVYGLGADGLNGAAVARIFAAKGRPVDNPLILHVARKEQVETLTTGLSASARALIETFWPGPLTVVVPKAPCVPDETSAGLDTVAVRMPSHPVANAFIAACGCPIAAPSANLSGKPSPTNAADVAEDMDGKIAGILDGGSCGIGVESTVVDTTSPIPTILRPGGITREMLENLLGAVDIDPALAGNPALRPKAPGMKYRHYAPAAPLYLYEGDEAPLCLARAAERAAAKGVRAGILCDAVTARSLRERLGRNPSFLILSWGRGKADLAENLYTLLRDFDRFHPQLILGMGVDEGGMGLAVMNRLRKAAGFHILQARDGVVTVQGGTGFPDYLLAE
ncbi:MAG: L-threonylcarbamoyladenylate synthase [Succiniclasticum sp.]|nr:threonylcarbamoyl-AMP synthase [Selenomonadales bacterium]MDY2869882.1 L-threonylcarbamoyladenylate synthase [Succiniclasticum sp.]MDY6303630.1 L-threonylcarbamoyladenylate synthase [Succiniclasticum sp.]MDY6345586.1 L-threonylcarbamoyladenylate synthase [Succiniclasticum sp.]